jgi:benzoate-CoA ligase family protein
VTAGVTERHNASVLIDRNLEAGRADKVAILAADRSVTYAELARQVARTGHVLRDRGVGREHRVLLVLDDTPAFPATFLGAMRIGAVPIPVSPLDRVDNLRYFVEDSGARVVVVDANLHPKVAEALTGRDDVLVLSANGPAEAAEDLDAALADQPDELTPVDTHRDDMAFWLYSSGSTGRPKGVVHLHHDLDYTYETYGRQVLRITESDVAFSSTKLFHAYGLGNGLTFVYSAGATSVLKAGPPRPDTILDTIERFRPTIFFSVPALYAAIVKDPASARRDLSSVRFCVSAAEALPEAVQTRWRAAFGLEILDGIGSTEMLHIFCSNRLDDIAPGTSGRPVPGYELAIIDDEGRPVADGEQGDLLVRGDSCAAFYWRQHEKTKRCMRGEWFYTGDRYVRDQDGHYIYQGRADDMLKIGGLWVSPADMEGCLVAHPAVSEAAVIGVTVQDTSRIKAFVICRERPEDPDALADGLRAWCKERLRRYEYPHVIEFVEDFPRTLTGKVQRYKLREAEVRTGS